MELKQQMERFEKAGINLLIVPYGIETENEREYIRNLYELLIVPYGIETAEKVYNMLNRILLIVPYGIETKERQKRKRRRRLLIVPYGIETTQFRRVGFSFGLF